jgi:hypothetical protein
MTYPQMNRRQVLKRVGTVGVLGAGGLSSGAHAKTSNTDGKGPVRARGTIQWRYEHTPDTLTVEEWYVSPDLKERYGTPRMRFDRTVYDRDQFPDDVDASLPQHGTRVATTKLDRLVGTESEWATHIESERESGGVSISNHSDYQGPIWEYNKSDGVYSRTAPVNLVWETENTHNLGDVVSKLKEGSYHGLGSCAQTKYVYISGHGFTSQDDQVGNQDYCGDAQDHVRMWYDRGDFGAYYGQFEIGSIHHDPAGHNYGCCCDNFTFDPPEGRMKDYWRNNSNASYVGSIDLNNANSWSGCKDPNDDYAGYIEWNS